MPAYRFGRHPPKSGYRSLQFRDYADLRPGGTAGFGESDAADRLCQNSFTNSDATLILRTCPRSEVRVQPCLLRRSPRPRPKQPRV